MQSFVSSHTLIFLIGDMRELGTETESLHRQLAQEIVDIFSHQMDDVYFYLVGPYMTEYVLPILK
jgi:UDP-N-acetylmuramyl pentapeptide synthase